MNVYTPQQLRKMSVEEINEAINRDLYVDAYAVQREAMVAYRGKRPAESLESVLCICPKCGKLGHMKSENDMFRCLDCGYEVRYDEYGFFRGGDVVFDSVTDWDKFQTSKLQAMADSAGENELIFSDSDMELISVSADHKSRKLGTGSIALYRDRFECCGKVFPIEDISGFALHGPVAVNFSHGDRSYELKPKAVACTRKYQTVIHHLLAHKPAMQS